METLSLTGLRAPASIHIDTWGLAHIRAQNAQDAFFVQGLNAARDRLWQIDLWRKRGLGRLAADFGPGYLMQDRAARLFLYRGDMAPEWAAYGDDAKEVCAAFAAGINAGVDLVLSGTWALPPEFDHLGTRPAHWAADDVVRIRTHCLMRNALSEHARARVHLQADAQTDLLRQSLNPPIFDMALPIALPTDAMAVYQLATAPVTFSAERLTAPLAEAALWTVTDASKQVHRTTALEGSNNWAIAPSRTATGRAIMASDPHRAHSAPSLRYMVHLTAPGMNLIGAGEPSSPGIMAGHNGTAAFSLTIFCADQEDLMVYETRPEAPTTYRYGDGLEEMVEITEAFAVKGHPDQHLALHFTRHGPVIHNRDGIAVAIRTVFTDPGTAPYMASLKTMRTTTMAGFRAALTSWGAPSVNMVYADTSGDICWQAAAYVPRRKGWQGLAPVSGAGTYEWDGYLTSADLPALVNPDAGFVHSANEMNLPDNWDHRSNPVGFEWFEDARADRIAQVIGDGGARDVAANCTLQTDTNSDLAIALVALLPGGTEAQEMLRNWDGSAQTGSGPALLYEVWLEEHLRPALLDRVAPDTELRHLLAPGSVPTLVRLMQGLHPNLASRAGLETKAARTACLIQTLQGAFEHLQTRFGPDTTNWRWGDLHKGWFAHAVASDYDVGPIETGGSGTSVMMGHYEGADYRVCIGASIRMVVDVGAWDKSVWINAPGQSGVPGDPHYDDLSAPWAAGQYVPMLYSSDAVDGATETVITLIPAGI